MHYVSAFREGPFQPMKASFGLLPELEPPVRNKRQRYAAYAARARRDLDRYISDQRLLDDWAPSDMALG